MVETDQAQQPPQNKMTDEEKAAEYAKFEKIIYENLERILEKRPALPVSKFAKA